MRHAFFTNQEPEVGGFIKKCFDKKWYRGKVENMDEVDEEGTTLYHIVYDDGDEEDLHYEECRRLHNLYLKEGWSSGSEDE